MGLAAIGAAAVLGALGWFGLRRQPRGQLPPRPRWLQIASPQVREAYDFALARPDILAYIPCYCGCARLGHQSNLDCFLSRPSAAAAPQFGQHAAG